MKKRGIFFIQLAVVSVATGNWFGGSVRVKEDLALWKEIGFPGVMNIVSCKVLKAMP